MITNEKPSELCHHFAYTLNHAIFCTLSDPVTDPIIGTLTQDFLQKHFPAADTPKESSAHLGIVYVAELAGDFLAVPLVVMAQLLFPHFMQHVSKTAEPILGAFFKNGAERSARQWAARHEVSLDSTAYKEKVKMIYKREIDNLPKLLLWTVSSVAINIGTQRVMGNDAPLWHLFAGKASGAGVTALLTTLARGLAPGLTDAMDQFTHHHLVDPLNRFTRNILGDAHHTPKNWEVRIKNEPPAPLGLRTC